jgi:hypothetical protein
MGEKEKSASLVTMLRPQDYGLLTPTHQSNAAYRPATNQSGRPFVFRSEAALSKIVKGEGSAKEILTTPRTRTVKKIYGHFVDPMTKDLMKPYDATQSNVKSCYQMDFCSTSANFSSNRSMFASPEKPAQLRQSSQASLVQLELEDKGGPPQANPSSRQLPQERPEIVRLKEAKPAPIIHPKRMKQPKRPLDFEYDLMRCTNLIAIGSIPTMVPVHRRRSRKLRQG